MSLPLHAYSLHFSVEKPKQTDPAQPPTSPILCSTRRRRRRKVASSEKDVCVSSARKSLKDVNRTTSPSPVDNRSQCENDVPGCTLTTNASSESKKSRLSVNNSLTSMCQNSSCSATETPPCRENPGFKSVYDSSRKRLRTPGINEFNPWKKQANIEIVRRRSFAGFGSCKSADLPRDARTSIKSRPSDSNSRKLAIVDHSSATSLVQPINHTADFSPTFCNGGQPASASREKQPNCSKRTQVSNRTMQCRVPQTPTLLRNQYTGFITANNKVIKPSETALKKAQEICKELLCPVPNQLTSETPESKSSALTCRPASCRAGSKTSPGVQRFPSNKNNFSNRSRPTNGEKKPVEQNGRIRSNCVKASDSSADNNCSSSFTKSGSASVGFSPDFGSTKASTSLSRITASTETEVASDDDKQLNPSKRGIGPASVKPRTSLSNGKASALSDAGEVNEVHKPLANMKDRNTRCSNPSTFRDPANTNTQLLNACRSVPVIAAQEVRRETNSYGVDHFSDDDALIASFDFSAVSLAPSLGTHTTDTTPARNSTNCDRNAIKQGSYATGFTTASNQVLSVSAASMARAKALLDDTGKPVDDTCDTDAFTVQLDRKSPVACDSSNISALTGSTEAVFAADTRCLPVSNHCLEAAAGPLKTGVGPRDSKLTAVVTTGFKTASNKTLSVASASLEKAKSVLSEIERSDQELCEASVFLGKDTGEHSEQACEKDDPSSDTAVVSAPPTTLCEAVTAAGRASLSTSSRVVSTHPTPSASLSTPKNRRTISRTKLVVGSCPRARARNSAYRPPRRKSCVGPIPTPASSVLSIKRNEILQSAQEADTSSSKPSSNSAARKSLGLKQTQEEQIMLSDENLLMAVDLLEDL